MSQVLRNNLDTFAPAPADDDARTTRAGVYATIAGALLAIAGVQLPWLSVAGIRVGTSSPVTLLALVILALAAGRYLLPRVGQTLAWGQLVVGGLGLLFALGPIVQAVRLSQVPLLSMFVGIGPGALLSLAGFGLVIGGPTRPFIRLPHEAEDLAATGR